MTPSKISRVSPMRTSERRAIASLFFLKRLTLISFVGMATVISSIGIEVMTRSASWAQGNLSDVTGPIVTTSDLINQSLQSDGAGESGTGESGGDNVGGRDVDDFAFACIAAGNAVDDALQQAIAQLNAGTLPPPSKGLSPALSLPEFQAAQANVANLALLTDLSDDQLDALAQVQTLGDLQGVLIEADIPVSQAAQLTTILAQIRLAFDLVSVPPEDAARAVGAIATVMDTETISAGELQRAIETYNQVVNNASTEFLQTPSPEFQVVQALLERLTAIDADELCQTPDPTDD